MQRLRRGTAAGLIAAACLLAVACTPATGGGPPPTAQPTATPTPSEDALSRQRRLDFAAAEKAFRTFRAERERLLIAGGASGASAVMKATGTGPFLKEADQLLRDFKDTGSRQVGKELIPYVREGAYSDTALLLDSCLDSGGVTIFLGKKSLGKQEDRSVRLEARKVEGTWKIWSATSEEVASCA